VRLRRDFTNEKGEVDWNHFRDFTVDVTGKDGTDPDDRRDQYTDASGVIHGDAGFAGATRHWAVMATLLDGRFCSSDALPSE
jgi:hypothetical protein